nr:hypothetical protein [Tanacetum cinerariifolium]
MSLDDLYNHLKVYEAEVHMKSKSNSQNMAFISSSKNNNGNEDGNIACASTSSTIFPTASANIDEDDMEEMDIKWNMALLSMRADKWVISQESAEHPEVRKEEGKKAIDIANEGEDHALVANAEASTEFALMSNTESKAIAYCSKDLSRRKFPTASRKFTTDSTKIHTVDMGKKGKAVKPSAFGHGILYRNYLTKGISQNNIDDKGYWDSGCSRHITGNISYLFDFEPFDGGYVSFGQGGCKISGKGTIKTGKFEFENVYFVKDLKYNLFSVSQICDNKNSVLFTDAECIMLRRNFKLLDDANILLRTPRQHNMYSIDLNNIVLHKDLTCLVAKASADECILWHRRLSHLNVKTMNKLVRHKLVRGLPTKSFNNDHTCTACLKGKQHIASCKSKTKDETSDILKKFITEIEDLKDLKVTIIRVEADISNMETTISANPNPTLRIHKDHPKSQIIGPMDTSIQTRHKSKEDWSYMENEGDDHALVADAEASTEFALMANTESKVFDNSLCSNDCKKNNDSLNSKIKDLTGESSKANNYIYHYKLAVAQLEGRLVEYKEREVKYIEKIRTLEMYRASNLKCIKTLDKELEELKLEKDGLDGKLEGLLKASKNLDNLIESQRSDKKDLSWTGLPEFVDDTITDYSRPSPIVASTSAEGQNKDSSTSKDVASPNIPKPFVKFVKPKDSQSESKTDKQETPKKPQVKCAKQYRHSNKKPKVKGNQRN